VVLHSSPAPSESLLIFSDVHLGSDLQECAQKSPRRPIAIDRDLVALLRYYRAQQVPADRWRIVIAGDFIDFIGMSIAPSGSEALDSGLTEEEREHGLGSAEDHARVKLARVAKRHADVFEALASFVADGHALTLVHGNHDIEFHWDGVKSDFRALLFEHVASRADVDRETFFGRIEFRAWFFYRDGVAYVEHGHQYDPYCSTSNVMAPLSPMDPRRVARGFSDVLLRFVVRRTRGMSDHGHENLGVLHYIRFAARLGASGLVRLGLCFARAVVELFRLRREHFSEGARILREEHEHRVARLGEATRIGVDRLRALLALQAPPITRSIRGILASVLLDRLALAMLAVLTILALAVFGAFHGHGLYGCIVVPFAWAFLHRHLARQRHLDASEALAERATHLSRLFPAAFVVMGHTHVPVYAPAGDATYINLGSWAEEELEPDTPEQMNEPVRAARTHVVIHVRGDRPEAHFRTWDGTGVRGFSQSNDDDDDDEDSNAAA
jgi:UDP-2,3-diacylglucosamine pyrophosphatase LpxH